MHLTAYQLPCFVGALSTRLTRRAFRIQQDDAIAKEETFSGFLANLTPIKVPRTTAPSPTVSGISCRPIASVAGHESDIAQETEEQFEEEPETPRYPSIYTIIVRPALLAPPNYN